MVQGVQTPESASAHEKNCICKLTQEAKKGFESAKDSGASLADIVVMDHNIFMNSFSGITEYDPTGQVAMQTTKVSCSGICQEVKVMTAATSSSSCVPSSSIPLASSGSNQQLGSIADWTGHFCGLQIQAKKDAKNPGPNYCHQLKTCDACNNAPIQAALNKQWVNRTSSDMSPTACAYNLEGWYVGTNEAKLKSTGVDAKVKCLPESVVLEEGLVGAVTDCALGAGSCKDTTLAGRKRNSWDLGAATDLALDACVDDDQCLDDAWKQRNGGPWACTQMDRAACTFGTNVKVMSKCCPQTCGTCKGASKAQRDSTRSAVTDVNVSTPVQFPAKGHTLTETIYKTKSDTTCTNLLPTGSYATEAEVKEACDAVTVGQTYTTTDYESSTTLSTKDCGGYIKQDGVYKMCGLNKPKASKIEYLQHGKRMCLTVKRQSLDPASPIIPDSSQCSSSERITRAGSADETGNLFRGVTATIIADGSAAWLDLTTQSFFRDNNDIAGQPVNDADTGFTGTQNFFANSYAYHKSSAEHGYWRTIKMQECHPEGHPDEVYQLWEDSEAKQTCGDDAGAGYNTNEIPWAGNNEMCLGNCGIAADGNNFCNDDVVLLPCRMSAVGAAISWG